MPVAHDDESPSGVHIAVGAHHRLAVTLLLPGVVDLGLLVRHAEVEGVRHERPLLPTGLAGGVGWQRGTAGVEDIEETSGSVGDLVLHHGEAGQLSLDWGGVGPAGEVGKYPPGNIQLGQGGGQRKTEEQQHRHLHPAATTGRGVKRTTSVSGLTLSVLCQATVILKVSSGAPDWTFYTQICVLFLISMGQSKHGLTAPQPQSSLTKDGVLMCCKIDSKHCRVDYIHSFYNLIFNSDGFYFFYFII